MQAVRTGIDFAAPDPTTGPVIDALTYAIGDIHGRFDLFKKMIGLIKTDADARHERPRIVLLGDYIDRGPDSAKVLDAIWWLKRQKWCEVVTLLGNHEDTMLKFLKDSCIGSEWFRYGGLESVRSFGVRLARLPETPEEWELVRARLSTVLTPRQYSVLKGARLFFDAGDYVFVHAGIDPDKDRAYQTAETFLWIREPFLKVKRACSQAVVHGHTPSEEVVNEMWRIGLDTGAYATGILSAVRLCGRSRKILQATTRDGVKSDALPPFGDI
ncbi:metallophosphoesterase family protein [Asticcacaulis sp. DXS10W]|uniref:Metallophosphoesterase family protein n=1 Tax=Asticcacaulis currens TaxID=2984210 RepID=A0ABT5I992_9CAUL|nr:metallophosphoesterase family protein [Asticcacaulis currens]